MKDQRKFYYNRQLNKLCEVGGNNEFISVSLEMLNCINAFGLEYYILDIHFLVNNDVAEPIAEAIANYAPSHYLADGK